MTEDDVEKLPAVDLAAVVAGGSLDHGEAIHFVIRTADGAHVKYRCEMGYLPQLLNALRAFGSVAHQAQAGQHNPDGLVVTHPYRMIAPPRLGAILGSPGDIGMEIQTDVGIPLPVSMPREIAKALSKSLREALLGQKPTLRGH